MIIEPKSIAFLYSYKCNFSCPHCSINAGPWHSEVLPLDVVTRVLEEAYYISSIQLIVTTGGEPTLFPDHLRGLVKRASELSFITRVVTNAWWASTYEKARAFLDELKSLGLDELNISYDDFHDVFLRRYGGFNNVVNAAKAAVDLGIRVAIATIRGKRSLITAKWLRERLREVGLEDKVYILEDYLSPTSRAMSLFDDAVVNVGGLGCSDAGVNISVHPNGDVAFCCGHIINDGESSWFTRVGNVYRERLVDIVKRMRSNVLIWYIRLVGPHRLVWRFNEEEKVYHICHACHLLATKYWDRLVELAQRKEEWAKELVDYIKSGKYISDLQSESYVLRSERA